MFRLANILLSRAGIDKLPAPQPFKTGAWRSDRPDNRGRAAMHHDLHERNWDYSRIRARRALRLPAHSAQRVRRSDGSSQALGPRSASQGAKVRELGGRGRVPGRYRVGPVFKSAPTAASSRFIRSAGPRSLMQKIPPARCRAAPLPWRLASSPSSRRSPCISSFPSSQP